MNGPIGNGTKICDGCGKIQSECICRRLSIDPERHGIPANHLLKCLPTKPETDFLSILDARTCRQIMAEFIDLTAKNQIDLVEKMVRMLETEGKIQEKGEGDA